LSDHGDQPEPKKVRFNSNQVSLGVGEKERIMGGEGREMLGMVEGGNLDSFLKLFLLFFGCVCVREREKEREREWTH
jgi:hypothetical protein